MSETKKTRKSKKKKDDENKWDKAVDSNYQPKEIMDKIKGLVLKHETSSEPKMKIEYETSSFGGERIKRVKTDVIPHYPPLPQNESFAHGLICGASGSGKSTFLLEILPKYKNVSGVLTCSLIEGLTIYEQVEAYCYEKKIKYKFTPDVVESYSIAMELINGKPPGSHTLLLYDDIQTGNSMKSSSSTKENKILLHLFSKSRNYGCSVIFITQSYITIPTSIRTNVNWIANFKMTNRSATFVLKTDVQSMTGYNKEAVDEVFHLMGNTPHSYLLWTREPSVYFYDNNTPNEPAKKLTVNNDGDDDDFDLSNFPIIKLIKLIQKNPTSSLQTFFVNYIKLLCQVNKLDLNTISKYIKETYNIDVY
jgi:hypothetical protein